MTEEHEYHCKFCGYVRDPETGAVTNEGGDPNFRAKWLEAHFGHKPGWRK